jgi:hypothetical protein
MDFDTIYSQLKDAGIITSQSVLSEWCGMQPNYVSSRKAKGELPSIPALMTLWFNLEDKQQKFVDGLKSGTEPTPEEWNASVVIYDLKKAVWEEIKSMLPIHRNL